MDETPVIDSRTGEVRGTVVGLEGFSRSFQSDVDMPHQLAFSGWQMADDNHPVGTGVPGYRLVRKTIRTVPFPSMRMEFANLLVQVGNGEVTVGEPLFRNALPGRREGEYLVPEWGSITESSDGRAGYQSWPNANIDIKAHQETFPPGNYVEVMCHLPESTGESYADQLAAGRGVVASLMAILDLVFGERLLGPTLTEEVGELFEDWHWNRKLGGRRVALEGQARLQQLNGNEVGEIIGPIVNRFLALPDEDRQRIRVASQWYWHADSEPDNVLRFIGYWLVVEALELGENANITPVKETVADILGVTKADVTSPVGLLYSTRNKLVHGKQRIASDEEVEHVRAVASALLEEHALGAVSTERRGVLRDALGVHDRGSE